MRTQMLAIVGSMLIGFGANSAGAVPFALTFEGLQNLEQVLDFYNGGTGSLGSSGPNFGVSFGSSALALIDADDGGTGNFANEPSPDTIAFFLSGGSLVMNVAAGFSTGFAFYYSSGTAATVTVYDGLNATGNVLGVLNLVAQGGFAQGCAAPGDPTGYFNCWDPSGVSFAGIARSVDFAGTADQTGFDNITFESDIPAPEPTSALLLAFGLLGLRVRRWLDVGA